MGPTHSHFRAFVPGFFCAWSDAETVLRFSRTHFLLLILQVFPQAAFSQWDCHWPHSLRYSYVVLATVILNHISLLYFLQGTCLKLPCLLVYLSLSIRMWAHESRHSCLFCSWLYSHCLRIVFGTRWMLAKYMLIQ